MTLSLVSLNVERSKHLDTVLPFLKERMPDVVCLQELTESDIPRVEQLFKARSQFVPCSLSRERSGEAYAQGICIFSSLPISHGVVKYYVGSEQELPVTVVGDAETYQRGNRAVVFVDVGKEGESFRIGTTHFTWSARGEATELQKENFGALLGVLGTEKEFVLCGDFNMPRGGELFTRIAEKYTDNIPLSYKTSIDIQLHRGGATDAEGLSSKMVDGLFTTPQYVASDVALVSGVSDHCAIVANITKR